MPFGSRQAWLASGELSQPEDNKLKRLLTDLSLNKAMLPYPPPPPPLDMFEGRQACKVRAHCRSKPAAAAMRNIDDR